MSVPHRCVYVGEVKTGFHCAECGLPFSPPPPSQPLLLRGPLGPVALTRQMAMGVRFGGMGSYVGVVWEVGR